MREQAAMLGVKSREHAVAEGPERPGGAGFLVPDLVCFPPPPSTVSAGGIVTVGAPA
jgi:hypothetical protein